jgi:hypothetical protein
MLGRDHLPDAERWFTRAFDAEGRLGLLIEQARCGSVLKKSLAKRLGS